MAHDLPELPEMIATVREFIADITPQLNGLERYHGLCAQFLLDATLRELAGWAPVESADDRRLRKLLGAPAGQPMKDVMHDLCRAIRAGRFDNELDALRETLTAHVVDKVRVAKPAVLAAEHRETDRPQEREDT